MLIRSFNNIKPFSDTGELNGLNEADSGYLNFSKSKLTLFLLIPITLPKIDMFLLNFYENGDKME